MSDFKPLLAGTVEDTEQLKFPLYASPKLDGIRAVVIDGVLLSRNLKPIPNAHVQRTFGKKKYNGLDGELIFGDPTSPTAFRDTSSAVMSHEGKPDVMFHVFDDFSHPCQIYTQREMSVRVRVKNAATRWLAHVPFTPIIDFEDLLSVEERWLEAGYEGVMLRGPNGRYKFGRSTLKEGTLLKLKRFADSEAVIIGVEEQMQNTNEAKKDALGHTERSSKKAGLKGKGTLGSLVVHDIKTKVEFSIGTGMDDALRALLWAQRESGLLGQIVKYRYFPTGSKERPRFPVFIGIRDPLDL